MESRLVRDVKRKDFLSNQGGKLFDQISGFQDVEDCLFRNKQRKQKLLSITDSG